jgi:hypothetical protein
MDNEERFALAARITELERELERVRACNRQGDALVALLQSQLAARRTVSGQEVVTYLRPDGSMGAYLAAPIADKEKKS